MRAFLVVLPIFLVIILGWALKYKGRLSPSTLRDNNFFLYWFAAPSVLLRGILGADVNILGNPAFILAAWLPYLTTVIIVWVTARRFESRERFAVLALSAIRGNHFFAGIPIVGLAMGPTGVAAGTVLLAASLVVLQMLSLGSGQLALYGKVSWQALKSTALQLLKNPLFLSCLLGIVLVLTGLNELPGWLDESLGIVAGTCTGLALMGLGAGLQLENVFRMIHSVWKILLFKLVVHPAVTWLILSSFGLSLELVQAGTLLAAMPIAINTSAISEEMGMDGAYCARGVAMSTLVSLLTMPLWIKILGIV